MWSIFAVAVSGLSGAGNGISASPHAGCGAGSAGDPTAARHGTPGAAAGRVRRGHHLASLLSRGHSPFLSPNPETALFGCALES